MSELNIKGVDDALLKGLVEMAKAHDRTVEAEALELLQAAIEDRRKPSEAEQGLDRLAIAKRISAMTPEGPQKTDSLELLREDRSR